MRVKAGFNAVEKTVAEVMNDTASKISMINPSAIDNDDMNCACLKSTKFVSSLYFFRKKLLNRFVSFIIRITSV